VSACFTLSPSPSPATLERGVATRCQGGEVKDRYERLRKERGSRETERVLDYTLSPAPLPLDGRAGADAGEG
jgi:hypothetical protein